MVSRLLPAVFLTSISISISAHRWVVGCGAVGKWAGGRLACHGRELGGAKGRRREGGPGATLVPPLLPPWTHPYCFSPIPQLTKRLSDKWSKLSEVPLHWVGVRHVGDRQWFLGIKSKNKVIRARFADFQEPRDSRNNCLSTARL